MMAAPNLSTQKVLVELRRRMDERASAQPADPKRSYLLAASVLHVFDPAELQPWPSLPQPMNAYQEVFEYSTSATGWRHRGFRTIKSDTRRSALSWLWRFGGRSSFREAVAANPGRIRTDAQLLFE